MTGQQKSEYLKNQVETFLNFTADTDNREIAQQYHIIYESLPPGQEVNDFYWGLRGNPDYVALRDNDLQGDEKAKTLARLKELIEKLKTAIETSL